MRSTPRQVASGLRRRLTPASVAGQVLLLQVLLVTVLVLGATAADFLQARRDATQDAYDRSLSVAETFAHAPGTRAAMESRDPSALLQPSAEATRRAAGVTYVVAFAPDGIRWSHPDPSLIGGHVAGEFAPALGGEPFQETFDSLVFGRAVDTTVAVLDDRGDPVGLVSVGITVRKVEGAVMRQLPLLLGAAAIALALSVAGTTLVTRRLRHQTHGLGPAEMTRMYEHHDAVLHAVREGVVILGDDGRLVLVNDEARKLLALPPDAGGDVRELGLPADLAALLTSGAVTDDDVRLIGDRLVSVNQRPIATAGSSGSVATLRDTTELRAVSARADAARGRLSLLYDAGVHIGTTLDVTRTAEELAAVAVPRFADFVTVELLEPVLSGDEPEDGAGTRMLRVASAGVRDDHPLHPVGTELTSMPGRPESEGIGLAGAALLPDLATSDAWLAQDPERAGRVVAYGIHSLVSVPLRARGILLGCADFWRKDKERFGAEDVAFAEELATRAALSIDNARRYTREHAVAVSLQRSLLPRAPRRRTALDLAHRYLPSANGVRGDWFDVIPLSGARVALVVGDVVGRGLHAVATMGRLRTAVRNFSALDLAPDELLAHLDELVARTDEETTGGDGDAEERPLLTGATCLYAVYDRVGGVCTLAAAGHPAPLVMAPDGTVAQADMPVSPPLGAGGGLPFETATLAAPEGSGLVLFTDGLVEDRTRSLDTGVALLADVLARAGGDPEEGCRAAVERLVPPLPADDVTLLIARTRLVDRDRVAEWDIPDDPAAVGPLRRAVARRLAAWGLEDLAYGTELIVSELVTNAIRYGKQPARLRLIHEDATLTCEVSDGSSTAPHLRRAAAGDEGGRGLFLVAQFAHRWGTRYLDRGKTIWTEQSLATATPRADLSEDELLDQWPDDL
ncbi:SpoIIE family protein phosphatase [Streptomyces sp. NPDC085460]|uniref:SpoIIE family protein phosphatase n=1 Tax=Streptomyces sp. NPDC085460 TaxID=3365723 RepID=UPI0037CCF58C